ncbi:MAG: PriCT-2 domain-containing protein [Burkholderiaceae bacterium]
MRQATLEEARQALAFVAPDDRDVWIKVGMGLKAEFGDDARGAWMEWSERGASYNADDAVAVWKSFKAGGKVGIGTLFALAKPRGFRFDKPGELPSPAELAARQREREKREAEESAERERRARAAANRAQEQWRRAARGGESAYLVRKQVVGENCRYQPDGSILIPMLRYDEEPARLVGKQLIAADGKKRYSAGMDKSGAACRLGPAPADGEPIDFVEGYATGLSVRAAGGRVVFVAFDAGQLPAVARIVRALYPSSPFRFCADDDYLTGGKGLAKAQEAAAAVGNAVVLLPVFSVPRRATKKDDSLPQLTDFNDLHVHESLDAVRAQLMASPAADAAAIVESPAPSDAGSVAQLPPWVDAPSIDDAAGTASPAPPDAGVAPVVMGYVSLEWALAHCALIQGTTDVWDSLNKLRMKRPAFLAMVGKESARFWDAHADRRTISPRALPKLSRGVATDAGGAGDEALAGMLDRYAMLYGTKLVWDFEKRITIHYDALALARGGDLAARWLSHPLHREYDYDKLVFDPTQRVDPATHINMFEGFPLTPRRDEVKAELALNLLWSLCSSEPNGKEVFEWVLCWLAYPLQHPGAKMQTALLFFGEKQGTGKSLFFEGIVKPIYGVHGATGGQNQLESNYTVWRSQKLFVLFEEILSRQDKYAGFGLVKHMITGRDTQISQKFKDDRVEANHMNAVMLSNEFQALPLEKDDRRMLVVDVRQPLDPQLLEQIKAALGDGLVEAFYAFLLEYPTGDFDPYAWPVMTESKQRVINFGLPEWEVFYTAWSQGELDAPYCCCVSEDLHMVYTKYCQRHGFRALSITKFSELIAQRVPKFRREVTLGSKPKKQRTVFIVPWDDETKPEESLSRQCDRFRDLSGLKGLA